MANLRKTIYLWVAFILVGVFYTVPVNASVTYKFTATEQPTDHFHKPLVAELRLSDTAVAAGQAMNADIESLHITGGTAVRNESPLTLSYMHPAFVNWTVSLAEDRNTITVISAILTPGNAPIDHWVLHQQTPPHPTLDIHENLGFVHADYVKLETMLLPVPPEHYYSLFRGEWKRASGNGPFPGVKKFIEMLACFPFCPLPWVIILAAVILPVLVWQIRRRRAVNR